MHSERTPISFFFHPDYTVGFGITPNHALRLVGFTTGGEFHSALKIYFVAHSMAQSFQKINSFIDKISTMYSCVFRCYNAMEPEIFYCCVFNDGGYLHEFTGKHIKKY